MYLSIKYLYPTATENDFGLRDDGNGPYIEYWDEVKLGPQPLQVDIDAALLPASIAAKHAVVKDEAFQRIGSVMPISRQMHTLARSALLLNHKTNGTATQAELDEAAAIEAYDQSTLQPIRDASNAIEAEIAALPDVASVDAYDIATNALWP